MIRTYAVIDDFCPVAERVRASALAAGFATWLPSRGKVGSSVYEGMGFWAEHAPMLTSLSIAIGSQVFPNAMFCRVTLPSTERAYIHSDRDTAAYTCVVYLSEHDDDYGTAFYRHRASGMERMPTVAQMERGGILDTLSDDMVNGGEKEWEQIGFVPGRFNRALIFDAPLFHSRVPLTGIGDSAATARMVWSCHFHTPRTLDQEDYARG